MSLIKTPSSQLEPCKWCFSVHPVHISEPANSYNLHPIIYQLSLSQNRSHFRLVIQRLEEICLHLFICNGHILNLNTGRRSYLVCCTSSSPWPMCTFSLYTICQLTWSLVAVWCHQDPASFVWKTGFMEQAPWKHDQKHRINEVTANKSDRRTTVKWCKNASGVDGFYTRPSLIEDTTSARKPRHNLSHNRQQGGLVIQPPARMAFFRNSEFYTQKLINHIIYSTLYFHFSFHKKEKTNRKKKDLTEDPSYSVRFQTVSSSPLFPHLLHPVKKQKEKKQYKLIIIFLL